MKRTIYFILSILLFISCLDNNKEMLYIKLLSPPGATTSNTITLYWETEDLPETGYSYNLEMNGSIIRSSEKSVFTVNNLSSDSIYQFRVYVQSGGITVGKSNALKVRTRPEGDIYDVTDFGAVGDGETLNTKAIQNAIDTCTQNGIVIIPKGIYRTGALFVKSNMTLYLQEGATIKGSTNPSDYPVLMSRHEGRIGKQYASLINGGNLYGNGIQNFSLRGKGVIIGEGEALFKAEKQYSDTIRGRILCLKNSENIYVKGISFLESPCRGVHFIFCSGVTLDSIYINTNFDPETGRTYKLTHADGLTYDSSKGLYLLNSTISSQDDAISLKSGRDVEGRQVGRSTEHVRIINCLFRRGQGVDIGSEMSGSVRDVVVNDCRFENTVYMVQIKAPWGRGGMVENIKYKNLTFSDTIYDDNLWHRGVICIDQYYGVENPDFNITMPVDEDMPVVRDISYENITINRKNGYAIYICGRPELFLKNIVFNDINATSDKGFYAYFVNPLTLNNVSVDAHSGDNFCLKKATRTKFGKNE